MDTSEKETIIVMFYLDECFSGSSMTSRSSPPKITGGMCSFLVLSSPSHNTLYKLVYKPFLSFLNYVYLSFLCLVWAYLYNDFPLHSVSAKLCYNDTIRQNFDACHSCRKERPGAPPTSRLAPAKSAPRRPPHRSRRRPLPRDPFHAPTPATLRPSAQTSPSLPDPRLLLLAAAVA